MARPINSIRKLQKIGRSGSLSIIIPAEIVRAFKLREHQRLLVKKINGAIIIRDARTKKRKYHPNGDAFPFHLSALDR